MDDLRPRFAANTAYSGLATHLEYGAAFLTSIVVARHLGAEQYGTYTFVLWLISAGVVLSNHGLVTGVMKFAGEVRGRGAPEVLSGVLRCFERAQMISVVAVIVIAGGIIAVGAERVSVGASGRVLWVALPAVAMRSLYVYYASAAKGLEDFRAGWLVQRVVAPASVLVATTLAVAGTAFAGFVWAYAAVGLVSAAGMRHLTHGRAIVPPPRHLAPDLVARIRRHVAYASASVLLELVVLRQTELVFLDWFSTREQVAYYGLGRSLASSALLLIPGVMTALLLPLMARTYGEQPHMLGGRFLATARYLAVLTMPAVVLGQVFADGLIVTLYGTQYGPAAMVFRVSVAAGAVGVVSASASSYQLGSDRQSAIVAIMTVVAVLTLILDYLLIRSFALAGAVIAGATGSILLGAGLVWHACRTLCVAYDWRTSAKIVTAAAVASLPAVGLARWLPLPVALPAAGVVFTAAYVPLTVLLGAWTRADLQSFGAFTRRVPSRLGRPAAALLDWAARIGASPAAQ
jgi:O-antigen/teichoic acid export membrane protein